MTVSMRLPNKIPRIRLRELTHYFRVPVDFETFSKILNRPGGFREPGEPEEYCRGFQVFDKDMTGFIGVGQLRYSGSLSALFQIQGDNR